MASAHSQQSSFTRQATRSWRRLTTFLQHFKTIHLPRHSEDSETRPEEDESSDKKEDIDKNDGSNASDDSDEDEEDMEPPSLADFFDSKVEYQKFDSFHTVYVRKDNQQILLQLKCSDFSIPFFNQLTVIGQEGGLPDMIDCTPQATGFQFRWAPNGKDVQLVQMQQELSSSDLASSLYDSRTGGALQGYLRVFSPVASDKTIEEDGDADEPSSDASGQAVEATTHRARKRLARRNQVQRRSLQKEPEPEHEPEKETGNEKEQSDVQVAESSSSNARKGAGKKEKKKGKKPLQVFEDSEKCVLLDMTEWFESFSKIALAAGDDMDDMGPQEGAAVLQEIHAFARNFWLQYSAQSPSEGPLKKNGQSATTFYVVAFCRLPEVPMVPRAKDRRVGYFETQLEAGDTRRANVNISAIHRWNVDALDHIDYHIDPGVPKLYWDTIRRGVESWNPAFEAAGRGTHVIRCLAPGDEGFPDDFCRGDARYNAIYMTDSALPVYGFGPSLVDFRSGEILVSHVLLGFSAFVEGASRRSREVLSERFVRRTSGCGPPQLDADHPDVLRMILFTVAHEVGHTLGLRHNFIAQEDGRSSVMAYPDDFDTTDPNDPVFHGYPANPGKYDIYAIKYGYTKLIGERLGERHPDLELLANGQDVDDTLSHFSLNPLFATDEDLHSGDPRVNTWNNFVNRCGYDKLEYAIVERRQLLELIKSGIIFPEEYTSRINSSYQTVCQHVFDSLQFLGGSILDASRTNFVPCSRDHMEEALRAVVDFCVGPVGRLTTEEGQFMMKGYPSDHYSVARSYLHKRHASNLERILKFAMSTHVFERLEMQASLFQQGSEATSDVTKPLTTLTALEALAYQPGKKANALFHPFVIRQDPEDANFIPPSGIALNASATDSFRVDAIMRFVENVHNLAHSSDVLQSVRIGAQAFIQETVELLKITEGYRGLEPVSKAFWGSVVKELKKEPDRTGPDMGSMFSFLDMGNQFGSRGLACGCGLRNLSRRQRSLRPKIELQYEKHLCNRSERKRFANSRF